MSRTIELPPSAALLSSSLRDLGYTLETAIADLIDNSITAGATEVRIFCPTSDTEPSLAVVDNGQGMSRDELRLAMQHGGRGLSRDGVPVDLGKYGLGLKTASLSQCRRLTVISRVYGGETIAMEWDLDLLEEQDKWLMRELSCSEIRALRYSSELGEHGAVVIWSRLDRVLDASVLVTQEEQLAEKVEQLEAHLSLVFHRFLEGEFRHLGKLAISINGHPVKPTDPFLRDNRATQRPNDPPDTVSIGSGKVSLTAYILPHFSKLPASERRRFRTWPNYTSEQGVYVYRNGRLLAWGGWFNLPHNKEATKYARVQIDFDSSLDEYWSIDIKKSKADPPRAVKKRLKGLLDGEIMVRSTSVHRGRGARLQQEVAIPLWERYADRNQVRYEISSKHPMVEAIERELSTQAKQHFRALLSALATSFPAEAVYADFASRPQDVQRNILSDEQLIAVMCLLRQSMFGDRAFDSSELRRGIESLGLLHSGTGDVIDRFLQGEYECQ